MSWTIVSGCPSANSVNLHYIVVNREAVKFEQKKVNPLCLPTATFVNPGRSMRVKFTTVTKQCAQGVNTNEQKSIQPDRVNEWHLYRTSKTVARVKKNGLYGL